MSKKLKILFFVILLGIAAFFYGMNAKASGDETVQIVKGGDTTLTGGDTNVKGGDTTLGGSDNFAIGYGPDNDINDCMAHLSVLIVTIPKRNKFCERQEFVRWAQAPEFHTPNSIKIMCSDPLAAEVFDSRDGCISTFTSDASDGGMGTTPPGTGPDEDGYRPDEAGGVSKGEGYGGPPGMELMLDQIAQQTEEYETLEQRVARIEQTAARPIPTRTTRIVERKEIFTEEQKSTAWSLLIGASNNREEENE